MLCDLSVSMLVIVWPGLKAICRAKRFIAEALISWSIDRSLNAFASHPYFTAPLIELNTNAARRKNAPHFASLQCSHFRDTVENPVGFRIVAFVGPAACTMQTSIYRIKSRSKAQRIWTSKTEASWSNMWYCRADSFRFQPNPATDAFLLIELNSAATRSFYTFGPTFFQGHDFRLAERCVV